MIERTYKVQESSDSWLVKEGRAKRKGRIVINGTFLNSLVGKQVKITIEEAV